VVGAIAQPPSRRDTAAPAALGASAHRGGHFGPAQAIARFTLGGERRRADSWDPKYPEPGRREDPGTVSTTSHRVTKRPIGDGWLEAFDADYDADVAAWSIEIAAAPERPARTSHDPGERRLPIAPAGSAVGGPSARTRSTTPMLKRTEPVAPSADNHLSEDGAGQDARAGIDGTWAFRRRADRSPRAGTSPHAKAPRPTWSDNEMPR
jgi:hypothetical protein